MNDELEFAKELEAKRKVEETRPPAKRRDDMTAILRKYAQAAVHNMLFAERGEYRRRGRWSTEPGGILWRARDPLPAPPRRPQPATNSVTDCPENVHLSDSCPTPRDSNH